MHFTLNTDGGARGNPGPAGIGAVIKDSEGRVVCRLKSYIGIATNNVAEYRALIMGLQQAATLGAATVLVLMDSELVVRQMNGEYKIKEPALKVLAEQARGLAARLGEVKYRHVRREQNREADELVNQAIDESGQAVRASLP